MRGISFLVFPIRNHAFENAIGRDRSIEGRADNTRPVLFRHDQPGDGRAVKVGTSGIGIGVIAALVELASRRDILVGHVEGKVIRTGGSAEAGRGLRWLLAPPRQDIRTRATLRRQVTRTVEIESVFDFAGGPNAATDGNLRRLICRSRVSACHNLGLCG